MYLAGHIGVALLLFAPLAYVLCRTGHPGRALGGTVTMLLLAALPDIDLYLPLAHRGPTHTVWAALCLGAVLWLVWRLSSRRPGHDAARLASLLGVLSVLGHLLGDVLTPMGIRPFAPLVATEYTLALVAARHPGANLVLLAAGVLAVLPSLRRAWALSVRPDPDAAGG